VHLAPVIRERSKLNEAWPLRRRKSEPIAERRSFDRLLLCEVVNGDRAAPELFVESTIEPDGADVDPNGVRPLPRPEAKPGQTVQSWRRPIWRRRCRRIEQAALVISDRIGCAAQRPAPPRDRAAAGGPGIPADIAGTL